MMKPLKEPTTIICTLGRICPNGTPEDICCRSCTHYNPSCLVPCHHAEDWDIHGKRCKYAENWEPRHEANTESEHQRR